MVITVGSELEAVLSELAHEQGVTPEALALKVLKERFLIPPARNESHDEWMRRLREAATDCGVALSNEALSSEGLYE